MDELFKTIFLLRKRTEVTSLFARKGFRIMYTDFDKVIFVKDDTQIEVSFNSQSHVQAVYLLDEEENESCVI